jgi:hypothetical protein
MMGRRVREAVSSAIVHAISLWHIPRVFIIRLPDKIPNNKLDAAVVAVIAASDGANRLFSNVGWLYTQDSCGRLVMHFYCDGWRYSDVREVLALAKEDKARIVPTYRVMQEEDIRLRYSSSLRVLWEDRQVELFEAMLKVIHNGENKSVNKFTIPLDRAINKYYYSLKSEHDVYFNAHCLINVAGYRSAVYL